MPETRRSVVVNAPADEVWGAIRGFTAIAEWHPVVSTAEIEGGGPEDQVGCVRKLTLGDGTVIRERLIALSDLGRSYTYNFQPPFAFPVQAYRATMSVSPAGEGASVIDWHGIYDCAVEEVENLEGVFGGAVYDGGLNSLKERFG